MSMYYADDEWVHIDTFHDEIQKLEYQLYPLKEYEKQVLEDSGFVLYKLMCARDLLAAGSVNQCQDALNWLISTFSDEEKEEALKNFKEELNGNH